MYRVGAQASRGLPFKSGIPATSTMVKPLTSDGGVVTGIPEVPVTQHRPVPINLDQYIKNPGAPRANRAVCASSTCTQLVHNYFSSTITSVYAAVLPPVLLQTILTSCRSPKRSPTALTIPQTTGAYSCDISTHTTSFWRPSRWPISCLEEFIGSVCRLCNVQLALLLAA